MKNRVLNRLKMCITWSYAPNATRKQDKNINEVSLLEDVDTQDNVADRAHTDKRKKKKRSRNQNYTMTK